MNDSISKIVVEAGRALAEKLKHTQTVSMSSFWLCRAAVCRWGLKWRRTTESAVGNFSSFANWAFRAMKNLRWARLLRVGLWFVNDEVVKQLGISRQQIKQIVEREERELERRAEMYGREFSQADVRRPDRDSRR